MVSIVVDAGALGGGGGGTSCSVGLVSVRGSGGDNTGKDVSSKDQPPVRNEEGAFTLPDEPVAFQPLDGVESA